MNILKKRGYNFSCIDFFLSFLPLFYTSKHLLIHIWRNKIYFFEVWFLISRYFVSGEKPQGRLQITWLTNTHLVVKLYTLSSIYNARRNIYIGKTAYYWEKQDISIVCYATEQIEKNPSLVSITFLIKSLDIHRKKLSYFAGKRLSKYNRLSTSFLLLCKWSLKK